MRFVVYGAGAVGGVIGARLFESGHDVALVARGSHGEAIRAAGLRLETPEATRTFAIPVAASPEDLAVSADDVVILAMKSQDTAAALAALAAATPEATAVLCAQNGVDNERQALRFFPNVYAITVMLPATHLEDGVVQAHSAPVTGILDIGRFPAGADPTADAVAAALRASRFSSQVQPDVRRWKYGKLLMNLANAVEALLAPSAFARAAQAARQEGVACLEAAGIDVASSDEDRARRGDLLTLSPVNGRVRGGGSSWQSLARGTGTIEADFLNGEIVALGRMVGVPTPVNAVLQRLARDAARRHAPPGSVPEADFWRAVDAADQEAHRHPG